MGRVNHDLHRAISGKVGPVVFYNRTGKNLRAPGHQGKGQGILECGSGGVRNNVKRMAAIRRQLDKNPVRETWKLATDQMSGYNLFPKTNLSAFKEEGTQADLERLHISFGNLSLPHLLTAARGMVALLNGTFRGRMIRAICFHFRTTN